MIEEKIKYTFEYTNTCTCTSYDEDTDKFVDMDYCDEFCWESTLDDFVNITKNLFDNNETKWWKVSNIRLWNREVSGYFYADNVSELLRGMAVNSEWIIRGEIFENYIKYSLSHHDAPTGSNTELTIISEEQRQELGLY